MKRTFYLIALLRRTTVLLACGLPVLATRVPAMAANRPVMRPAADVPVSGRVTGADGNGLPGVTVLVRGTSIGTSTAPDGSFSLTAPEGSTLVFSFVGFGTQTAVVASGTPVSVTLREDAKQLTEVVVVGYGTQDRGSVSSAISSVSGRDIATQPVADPTQALQGRAAGVTVTQNSGAPGGAGGTQVRVRGITSAGNNSPLYVVDGFPLPSSDAGGNSVENQLNAINPNDIETIDVLKDASATAIYGLRAANGVVIITTKRGKAGTSSITLDGYRGIQQVWRKLDLLNAEQYAVINNESILAQGSSPVQEKLRDPKSLGAGTDWQKAVFRPTAVIQSYNLSAAGGSEKARYAVSGGYFQQDGTLNGSNFERFTLRANGDIQLSKRVKIGNSLSVTHLSDRQLNTGNDEFGVLNNVLQAPPVLPVYRPDGTWYEAVKADNYVEPNPVLQSLIANTKFNRNRVLSTVFAEVEPLKYLRFRTNVGVDLIFDNGSGFTPSLGPNSPRNGPGTASAYAFSNYNPGYLIENTLTYDRLFAEKHQVTVLLGQSAQEFNFNSVSANRVGYLSNDLQQLNNGPQTNQTNSGTSSQTRLASYFGRVNYDFAGKYIFSATVRYDGSSAFATGYKFGFFPGASVGWRLSEEEFIKNISVISNLKLRAGYGRVGNPLNAGQFAYLATINTGITYPFGPGNVATGTQTINSGAAPTRAQNTQLRWEDNVQSNLGVDVGLFGNRIEATVDVYNRRSPNLINNVPAYLVTGTYEAVPTNSLVSYNRGIDVSLSTRNLVGGDRGLTWTTSAVFSAYKNRIEDLGTGGTAFNGATNRSGTAIVRYDKGQAFGAFYGYVAEGLFQTPEDVKNHATQTVNADPGKSTGPGDIRFKDLNGDGKITDADRTFIGNPNPDFTYGLNNTLSWHGLDLNVFVQGSQGNDVYNLNRVYTEGGLYSNGNSSTRVLGRWTGPGTSTDVPRAIAGDPNQNLRVSSYFLEDGSYLRLKTLTLGYNLPKSLTQRVAAQSLRVYVTGQNLVTLTKYTGFDPELGGRGIDFGVYPQSRVYLAGVNIGF
ncbi:SusC/RagA family TonB-linked outer membrane protein [Hymenobacter negativus]|uniref:TonB-dependent receptor n=1 Tax=Hymenobacter negativus TaxID=2795026 RepID=A0ABS0QAC8_9BACT|nr:TonB-dependent receptor [Hymenobacter negativus]MBH8559618.1 TonB-dependent receptor [Hymenobacter negativus]